MRRHMWMHVGMLAAILVLFGLRALGAAIPIWFGYLVLLACPVMMVYMMFGMDHDHGSGAPEAPVDTEHQPVPPTGTAQ